MNKILTAVLLSLALAAHAEQVTLPTPVTNTVITTGFNVLQKQYLGAGDWRIVATPIINLPVQVFPITVSISSNEIATFLTTSIDTATVAQLQTALYGIAFMKARQLMVPVVTNAFQLRPVQFKKPTRK